MDSENGETLQYQACAGIDGSINMVNFGKRNGRIIPILNPALTEYIPRIHEDDLEANAKKLFRQFSHNLTQKERRTFRKLTLENKSVAQTAAEERVSRKAIYCRIQGNSKGQGGMIKKNEFVELWWLRRRLEYEDTF
jgi:predicted DNA-binding protein YlxM (UPF0122 family)